MFSPFEGGSTEVLEVTPGEYITVYIPPVPPIHQIQNFDKPISEQKWQRTDYPDWWNEVYEDELYAREENDDYRDKRCEEFRRQEWKRRKEGHWIFIKGNPVYLPGKYYYYLNWVKNDNGYPRFRETDRKEFLFTHYTFENPKVLGYIKIGPRGCGKTVKEVAIILEEMTRPPRRRQGAIQSKTKDDAKDKIFSEKMVPVYVELPEFYKPESDHGTKPEGKLSFFRQAVRGKGAKKVKLDDEAELKNTIYPVPAKEKALDGGTYAVIMQDEIGKCLGYNTPILMYDGSIKMVQDVVVGDKLMGDDSTPRVVLGISTGSEQMYEIIPKKGMKWSCNESHILSLKLSSNNIIKGYSKNDTINISVKDYLNLSSFVKKHLMLYRVGVEYPENNHGHELPPYLLGLWLGDGKSSRMTIFNGDVEVEDYLIKFAKENNYSLKREIDSDNCYRYSFTDNVHGNHSKKCIISNFILKKNIKDNKHIPNEYLIDTRTNRLSLLAGIIDTDGHKVNGGTNKQCYEITQKNKTLAYQIHTLANSLGFYCSINPKIATMKRRDGTIYSSTVYRLFIYGTNLSEIPCLINRKKIDPIVTPHKNTRNPLRSGFSVKNIGHGNYYGFSIDGNRLFVLGDFTVTHNTSPADEADVHKRWQVNRFCVYRDHEKRGMLLGTSTIEEMKEGGEQCYMIWRNSDSRAITDNGFTISGALRYFTSCLDVTFFDDYGYPDKVKAKEYHDAERKARRDDLNELASYIRKNPYTPDEAFMEDADGCEFNAYLLNKRLEELNLKDPTTYFDLEWQNGRDSKVVFHHNPKGKFCASWLPERDEDTNLVERGPDRRREDGTVVPTWRPKNDLKFRIGCDPVQHGIDTVDKRVSDSAAYVVRLFDMSIDNNPDLVYKESDVDYPDDYKIGRLRWKTYVPIVEYIYRNDDPDDFFEDMIKLVRFFGCQILIENNKNNIINKFKDRGYWDFVMWRPKDTFTTDSNTQHTPGAPGVEPIIQQYIGLIKTYVMQHGHRIPFKRLIKDMIRFRRKNIKIHDPTVAFGYTLLATMGEAKVPKIPMEVDQLFATYSNNGTESQLQQ